MEINPDDCERLLARLRRHGLCEYVVVHCADSLQFLRTTNLVFDFGFFDSLCQIRTEEYHICRERNIIHGIAAFHDTSALRPQTLPAEPPAAVQLNYRRTLLELAQESNSSGYFEHSLSRGLFVIFHRRG